MHKQAYRYRYWLSPRRNPLHTYCRTDSFDVAKAKADRYAAAFNKSVEVYDQLEMRTVYVARKPKGISHVYRSTHTPDDRRD